MCSDPDCCQLALTNPVFRFGLLRSPTARSRHPRARQPVVKVPASIVLAFPVSARTREFGIRLAVGSAPRPVLPPALGEGVVIAAAGVAAGAAGGFALAQLVGSYIQDVHIPGPLSIVGAAAMSHQSQVISRQSAVTSR